MPHVMAQNVDCFNEDLIRHDNRAFLYPKLSVAATADSWLLSVLTTRETSPLVSAIRKDSVFLTIEIVIVALREISRAVNVQLLTQFGKSQ
jgi:hypothetical protein